jgi:hypothetical protein
MNDKLILECAKSLGFKPPKIVKVQEWSKGNVELFPVAKTVYRFIKDSDIEVHRAVTAPFVGSKDLGEWWITYPTSITTFRVTDEDFKVFVRDRKIKSLI